MYVDCIVHSGTISESQPRSGASFTATGGFLIERVPQRIF
jgi:hypothetical protein